MAPDKSEPARDEDVHGASFLWVRHWWLATAQCGSAGPMPARRATVALRSADDAKTCQQGQTVSPTNQLILSN
jgi:hypothetical protein